MVRLQGSPLQLIALWVSCMRVQAAFASRPGILQTRDDAPPTPDFLRRSFPAVIVLGDYVYIDGGEVSQLFDGKNGSAQQPSYAVNGTLSISLKTSWTNTSVTFKQSAKTAPRMNQQAIFRDATASGFYIWGGATPYFAQPPPLEIWRFAADGDGGGVWAKESPRGGTVVELTRAVRTSQFSYTQSRDVAYFLGGYANAQTDTSVTGDTHLALPGLMAFNMSSGELTNSSSTGLGRFGTLVGASAEYVPFGPAGVLLFLGGGETPIATSYGAWTGMDFNSLSLYDIATGKWYSQPTTGSRPTRRERFCAVGVQGPNKTFEIFLYGGVDMQASRSSDEVYVLSLPGFVFFKGPGSSTPRADHGCALVGKRQLLSVGGTDGFLGFPNSLLDPDPWKNGLGVFDMSRLAWSNGYKADAAPYESPSVVSEWYLQGGAKSVVWANAEVEELFAETAPPSYNPTATGAQPGDPPPSDPASANPAPSSDPNIGAIVGGVVGGLVVLLSLAAGAYWFRRSKTANRVTVDETHHGTAELPAAAATWDPTKATSEYYRAQLASPSPQELPGHPPTELPSSHGFSEVVSPHGHSELPART
ncbi:kelch repeat-containing protein [Podospora aff. communis PSN243]|uniref:Kelch repeat-containing protein n=1 Tax=Podospora aff. communis PSN243 TaxID=3040156 RepID=A0AAV9GZT5_9PEZI|nr:kelch repeat-containing protein [Podospora aff. communis PSN243]